jgi:Ricin-type beta-trefoil lectin domain/Domain of unknown function (DUF4476)
MRALTRGIAAVAMIAGGLWATRGEVEAQPRPRHWRGGRPDAGLPSGTGRLRNAAQGMCLDVAGWAAQGNFNVLLWDCNDDPDQVWSFNDAGEANDVLTGQCLDAAGYEGVRGVNVDTFRCEGLDDQRWALVPRGAGLFELHNLKRGLCLDVAGRNGGRGDNVALWDCDGGRDQVWSWEPYAIPARPAYAQRRPPGSPREMAVPPPPPPPTPPPPPPPPPARDGAWRRQARAMDEPTFRRFVDAVKNEGFADDQIRVIESASSRNYFRVMQLRAVLDLLAFSANKLRALELVAPRLIDPENTGSLYEAFAFSADKEQARQILGRSGY